MFETYQTLSILYAQRSKYEINLICSGKVEACVEDVMVESNIDCGVT